MKKIWPVVLIAFLCACPGPRGHLDPPATPYRGDTPDRPRPTAVTAAEAAIVDPPARREEPPVFDPPRKPVRDEAAAVSALTARLQDAYFPYDRSDLLPEAVSALRGDAALLLEILADFPILKIMVEGHCDERGSAEYNLGLGDFRAGGAAQLLRTLGVPPDHLQVVSYGKERPQCTAETESCRSLNRRAHLAVRGDAGTEPRP